MISRLELKTKAKESLRGRWVLAIGVTLIYAAISCIASYIPYLGPVVMLFCAPAFLLGLVTFFLKLSRNENVEIEMLFSGFSQFVKAFCVYFMMGLIIFLWSLLLIIPGIIAAYRYSMVFYILADNPDMGVMEILNESKRLTQGYKGAIFVLHLSFIGWALVGILTCGIGYLWLEPYVSTTMANMYNKLLEIKDDHNGMDNNHTNNGNFDNDNLNNNYNNNYNNYNKNYNNNNNDNLNNYQNSNNDYLNNDFFKNENLDNNYFDVDNKTDNNSSDNKDNSNNNIDL